jgi:hypothetical protein
MPCVKPAILKFRAGVAHTTEKGIIGMVLKYAWIVTETILWLLRTGFCCGIYTEVGETSYISTLCINHLPRCTLAGRAPAYLYMFTIRLYLLFI